MAINLLLGSVVRLSRKTLPFKVGKGGTSGVLGAKSANTREAANRINKQILKDVQSLKLKGSVAFEVKDHGAKRISRSLDLLHGSFVEIGFPGGKDYISPDGGVVMDVARLAIIHELGSRRIAGSGPTIPSRPANRLTYDKNLELIKKNSAGLYAKVLRGMSVKMALAQLGIWYEAKLKIGYRRGPFKQLSAATIAARQRRNRPSTVPLIDTRTLVNSITSKVHLRSVAVR